MPRPDLNQLLPDVVRIAREAGDAILEVYARDFEVDYKDDASPLTEADMASHRRIVAGLRELTPDIPVLSEESRAVPVAERQAWERFWLVDPLDGTKEFVKRNGEFTVNIALVEAGRPLLGVVHTPVPDVTYAAADGVGAVRRDPEGERPIAVRAPDDGTLRVVASRSHANEATERFLQKLRRDHQVEMASKGSALKLCLVAEGDAHLYPRTGPTMEWDTAAAQCVVEQAGGVVLELGAFTPLRYNKDDLLNPHFLVAWAADAPRPDAPGREQPEGAVR